MEQLGKQRAGFQSLTDGIDTTIHSGKLVFHIMGALAEFERDLIRERTRAGMKAARKRGKHLGRPKALSPGQIQHMRKLLAAGKTQREVAELLRVSANTVGRAIKTLKGYGNRSHSHFDYGSRSLGNHGLQLQALFVTAS